MPEQASIVQNEDTQRFEWILNADTTPSEKHTAYAQYTRFAIHGDAKSTPTGIAYTSVVVPKGYEGKGIGSQLVEHILQYAKSNGLTIGPVCPFVKAYMQRNPEFNASSLAAPFEDD